MSVYIEYVIIDNLVIDFLLLFLVFKSLRLKTSLLCIFLSAVVGTSFACIMPLIAPSKFVMILLKIVLSILMILIARKPKSFKSFLLSYLLFYLYTAGLGGVCFAVLMLFGSTIHSASVLVYDLKVPIGICLLIGAIYAVCLSKLASFLSKKREIMPFIRSVNFTIYSCMVSFKAYLDSGNRLYDSMTGLPVIVVSSCVLERNLKPELYAEIINNSSKRYSQHLMTFSTLSGVSSKMIVFKPDSVLCECNGTMVSKEFMIGVTNKKFKDSVFYEGLLHPSVIM
ncbi:MAG: sigma-E processing peptidase SpoIIGA [Clostridia bacterium]